MRIEHNVLAKKFFSTTLEGHHLQKLELSGNEQSIKLTIINT